MCFYFFSAQKTRWQLLACVLVPFLMSCANRQITDPQGLVADPDAQELKSFDNFEDAFSDASSRSVVGRYIGKGSNADAIIYFDFNSAYLALDGRKALDNTIEKIKLALQKRANSNLVVRIEGHTDERGSNSYNLALGQRRADAVARYARTQGISSTNLRIISYGETQPLSRGAGEIAWAENRRVEIKYTRP